MVTDLVFSWTRVGWVYHLSTTHVRYLGSIRRLIFANTTEETSEDDCTSECFSCTNQPNNPTWTYFMKWEHLSQVPTSRDIFLYCERSNNLFLIKYWSLSQFLYNVRNSKPSWAFDALQSPQLYGAVAHGLALEALNVHRSSKSTFIALAQSLEADALKASQWKTSGHNIAPYNNREHHYKPRKTNWT